jgi:hypothetical protein
MILFLNKTYSYYFLVIKYSCQDLTVSSVVNEYVEAPSSKDHDAGRKEFCSGQSCELKYLGIAAAGH